MQVILSVLVASVALMVTISRLFSKPKWSPKSRHCYVTGGSAGLGLSLAVLLTKQGADVSIVARDEERLQNALNQLEAVRQSPNQILKAYSFALDNAVDAVAAIEAACEPHEGRCPDAFFLCAGKSTPGYFVELDEASMKRQMDATYWVAAHSALAAAKRMARDKAKGKIIFVSSFLGYMSLVGYTMYSSGKFAIRGLAEALRSEMLLYGVEIHICFPGTIYSPGYIEENKTKPAVTLKIEETDSGLQPEQVAAGLLRGVQKGHFHITNELLGHIFRASTAGASPRNSYLMDVVYSIIGYIGLPIWMKFDVDGTVLKHREAHQNYLADKGFFNVRE